jgi:hypothetical protein
MPTLRALATQAMGRLGVLASGESMSAADANLCLEAINQLLDEWQATSLMLYAEQRTTWNIVPSQASYTVGDSAEVNVPRPVYVDWVSYVDTTQTPPLEIAVKPYTDFTWAAVGQKALTSNLPLNYYYNLTYPLATLYLWPIPTQASLQGVLYARTQVAQLASLDTDVALPNGWQRMIVTNLAVEIAPAFFREPSATLMNQAKSSLAAVKRSNIRDVDLVTPSAALIQTGNYGGWWSRGRFLAGP